MEINAKADDEEALKAEHTHLCRGCRNHKNQS